MKTLFIHLPNHSYRVNIEEEEFDTEVTNLQNVIDSAGSCWIPVHVDGDERSERHLFLTEQVKKLAHLETVET